MTPKILFAICGSAVSQMSSCVLSGGRHGDGGGADGAAQVPDAATGRGSEDCQIQGITLN